MVVHVDEGKRWSKRSLDCARCPRDGRGDGTDGCPCWRSVEDGIMGLASPDAEREEVLVGCGLRLDLMVNRALVRQVEGHAEAAEQGRNLVDQLLPKVGELVLQGRVMLARQEAALGAGGRPSPPPALSASEADQAGGEEDRAATSRDDDLALTLDDNRRATGRVVDGRGGGTDE